VFAIHKAEESMMKVRIAFAAMAGCMALAACGGGTTEENTLNADDANLMTDMNAGMTDLNTTTDMNTTMDMNADMNATDTTNTDATNTTNTY
jgi:hypothetical protein